MPNAKVARRRRRRNHICRVCTVNVVFPRVIGLLSVAVLQGNAISIDTLPQWGCRPFHDTAVHLDCPSSRPLAKHPVSLSSQDACDRDLKRMVAHLRKSQGSCCTSGQCQGIKLNDCSGQYQGIRAVYKDHTYVLSSCSPCTVSSPEHCLDECSMSDMCCHDTSLPHKHSVQDHSCHSSLSSRSPYVMSSPAQRRAQKGVGKGQSTDAKAHRELTRWTVKLTAEEKQCRLDEALSGLE